MIDPELRDRLFDIETLLRRVLTEVEETKKAVERAESAVRLLTPPDETQKG